MKAYERFQEEPGFACVATLEEIRAKDGNLSIPVYVASAAGSGMVREEGASYGTAALPDALSAWLASSTQVRQSMAAILKERP